MANLFLHTFRNFIWEIMHSTINKMSKHVEKLQKEAEDARDLLDAAKKKVDIHSWLIFLFPY